MPLPLAPVMAISTIAIETITVTWEDVRSNPPLADMGGHVDRLTDEQIAEFKATFSMFDTDESGTISSTDLEAALHSLGQHPTEDELQEMVNKVDPKGNGAIDVPGFMHLMAQA